MPTRRPALPLLLAWVAFLASLAGPWLVGPGPAATAQPDGPLRPRLAVLVVFDQLRGDYLERWQKLFVKGGFRRLQEEGAWFRNCHYPYAATLTAAGHASMATGSMPSS